MRTLDSNHAIELASAGSLPPLATGGFHECTQLRTLHCGDLQSQGESKIKLQLSPEWCDKGHYMPRGHL